MYSFTCNLCDEILHVSEVSGHNCLSMSLNKALGEYDAIDTINRSDELDRLRNEQSEQYPWHLPDSSL